LIFGGEPGWNEAARLSGAAAAAGLDLDDMDRAIALNPADYDAEIQRNEQALAAAGHWGVPTLVLRGEPFFGQDRLTDLVWRLEQLGLAKLG
jgi:2-hydroxychromene-2-carboxylate isomerase